MAQTSHAASPDTHSAGLIATPPDPLRYDWVGVFGEADTWEAPAIISRWLHAGRVLDVGCGSGAITEMVARNPALEITGVEPDAIRAQAARDRGLNVHTGLLNDDFICDHGSFDAILFTDVLEHLASPSDLLDIAKSGLRPGGHVIASVPNVAHWTVRLRLLLGRFDYSEMGIMDATHLRWFTRKSLRALFEARGLEVVEVSASTGLWLDDYQRAPFKWAPMALKRRAIQALARALPSLFGCQILIKARCADGTAG